MNVKEDMLKKKKEINEKTEIFIFCISGVYPADNLGDDTAF